MALRKNATNSNRSVEPISPKPETTKRTNGATTVSHKSRCGTRFDPGSRRHLVNDHVEQLFRALSDCLNEFPSGAIFTAPIQSE